MAWVWGLGLGKGEHDRFRVRVFEVNLTDERVCVVSGGGEGDAAAEAHLTPWPRERRW